MSDSENASDVELSLEELRELERQQHQQGRGDREQLPEGSGVVLWVIAGVVVWAVIASVGLALEVRP